MIAPTPALLPLVQYRSKGSTTQETRDELRSFFLITVFAIKSSSLSLESQRNAKVCYPFSYLSLLLQHRDLIVLWGLPQRLYSCLR